jgi:hypothetical protein
MTFSWRGPTFLGRPSSTREFGIIGPFLILQQLKLESTSILDWRFVIKYNEERHDFPFFFNFCFFRKEKEGYGPTENGNSDKDLNNAIF